MAADINKATQGYNPNASFSLNSSFKVDDDNTDDDGYVKNPTDNSSSTGTTTTKSATTPVVAAKPISYGSGVKVGQKVEVPESDNEPFDYSLAEGTKYAEADNVAEAQKRDEYGSAVTGVEDMIKPTGEYATGSELEDFYRKLNQDPELTPEQLKKKQRRERAEKAIAAIGDLGAIAANVVGTAKGAKSTQAGMDGYTLSGKYADKWNKWNEDYQKRLTAYRTGLEKAKQLDFSNGLKSRKEMREEMKNNALIALKVNQLKLNQAKAELAEQNAKIKAEQTPQLMEKLRRQIKNLEIQGNLLQAKLDNPERYLFGGAVYSSNHKSSTTGAGKPKTTYTINGVTYTDADSAAAHIPLSTRQRIIESLQDISTNYSRTPSNEEIVSEYIANYQK